MFYWLDRALGRGELKRWLGTVPGLDCATLNDVTPHYTARPLFIGAADPVPVRSRLIRGAADAVAVPDLFEPAPEPAREEAPSVSARPWGAPRFSSGGRPWGAPRFSLGGESYLHQVVEGVRRAPVGQGRQTLTSAALRLYGAARAGRVDRVRATALLKRAMIDRGWNADDTRRGMTMADVNRQLDWCWEHSEPR